VENRPFIDKNKMKETGALLAGEMSGHMFFADRYFGYDDAIYASCRLLEILSNTGKQSNSYCQMYPHHLQHLKSGWNVLTLKSLTL